MKGRRLLLQTALLALLSSGGAEVVRAGTILGASFGYTHVTYPDLSNFSDDVVGVPGAQDWVQPGMRVGYLFPGGRWAVNTDFGLVYRSGTAGHSQSDLELLPQVQWSLWGDRAWSPYITAGLGLEHETASYGAAEPPSETRATFGGGLGARRSVSDGHGFLRAEVRYDYLPKVEKRLSPFSTFEFLAMNQFSLKLGFDLVLDRHSPS